MRVKWSRKIPFSWLISLSAMCLQRKCQFYIRYGSPHIQIIKLRSSPINLLFFAVCDALFCLACVPLFCVLINLIRGHKSKFDSLPMSTSIVRMYILVSSKIFGDIEHFYFFFCRRCGISTHSIHTVVIITYIML